MPTHMKVCHVGQTTYLNKYVQYVTKFTAKLNCRQIYNKPETIFRVIVNSIVLDFNKVIINIQV